MDRRKLARVAPLLLIVVASAVLVGCPGYYALLMTFLGFDGIEMGNVVIAITMRDTGEPLTYYQDHMSGAALGAAEYSWGVQIDVDDDPTTGDSEGFDVAFTVKLESGGETTVEGPLTGLMIDVLPEMIAKPSESHTDTPDTPRLFGLAENTLYIGNNTSSWTRDETSSDRSLSPTFRARFSARFNDPPDPATEIVDTVELIGNGTQADPAEDVPHSVIDIIEVRIHNPEAVVQ